MEEKTLSIPALRSSVEEILNDHDLIASQKLFTEIFGSIAGISAVINNNRQIVYANDTFLEFLGIKSLEPVLGKRTGEVISCINSEADHRVAEHLMHVIIAEQLMQYFKVRKRIIKQSGKHLFHQ